jgi:peptidoglycan hydrolase CwlO-like protein
MIFRFSVFVRLRREAAILRKLDAIYEQGAKMAGELERLQTEVSEMSGVVDSAVVLIGGLAQQIRDLAQDPAALTAMADELDAKASRLAAAVAANTPTP